MNRLIFSCVLLFFVSELTCCTLTIFCRVYTIGWLVGWRALTRKQATAKIAAAGREVVARVQQAQRESGAQ